MNLVIINVLVISGCQLIGTNTHYRRDAETINQVMAWNDCAARCLGKSNCQFWTWHHGNSGKWANICVLMSGYGSRWEDSNTISGARGCLGTGSKYKNVWKWDNRWEPVKFQVCLVFQVLMLILGTYWTTFVFMSILKSDILYLFN